MSSATITTPLADRPVTFTGKFACCLELARPRIAMMVLVVVALSGLAAGWGVAHPIIIWHAVFGTLLVAASASAFNQILEKNSDLKMQRTANRPLPTGRLTSTYALVLAVTSFVAGLAYLFFLAGWQPATWAGLSWLIYVGAYTPMKSRSALNTLVGAISGALPVWIGWTAIDPQVIPWRDLRCVSLFLVVFLWQFPHFMAIAWLYRKQYSQAGMKMLTVVDSTGKRAALQAVLAASWLLPVSLLLSWNGPSPGSFIFASAAVSLGLIQVAFSLWFSWSRSDLSARYLLRCSIVYLPALLLLFVWIPWI